MADQAPDPHQSPGLSLVEALIATADRALWARYCRLAATFDAGARAPPPDYAIGSLEWQQQQQHRPDRGDAPVTVESEAAGRRFLTRIGSAPFAGMPSPFGAAQGTAFDEFTTRHRGPSALLAELDGLELQLIEGFERAGRAERFHMSGFHAGSRKNIEPGWFGRMRLDLARNAVALPDGSEIAGIEVVAGSAVKTSGAARERPARAMLRQALLRLWQRGDFTAGTGNERVLALALRELGLSASNPPYGFKSAETVRKLRKALGMSL